MTVMVVILAIWILAAAILVPIVMFAIKREKRIYTEGLETDSEVTLCEQYFDRDHHSRHRCYVKYIGNDGAEHIVLLNVRTQMPIGRKVKVRYLPGAYDEVIFVSQELD